MQRIQPYKTLDVFRGFAALWVVMVHCCDRWLPAADPKYLHQPLYTFAIRGQLGVILFFVISGYCITAAAYSGLVSGKSVWRYSFERIRRIYPPYLAALLLTVLSLLTIAYANAHHLIGPVAHMTDLPLSLRYWIANLLLLQFELNTPMVNVVFWSLGCEIAFYFLIGLFLAAAKFVARRFSLHAATLLFVCCVGLSTVATLSWMLVFGGAIFPFDTWHQFSIGGVLFFLMEMKPATVGNFTKGLRNVIWANVAAVTVLTLLFAAYRQVGTLDIGHPSSRVRSLLCLIFALCLIGLRRFDEQLSDHWSVRPLMWVGIFSYSLYLTHPIVLPYIDITCRKLGLNGDRYWIAFFLQLALAVLFGRLFYRLVERHFISKKQVQRIAAEQIPSLA